MALSLIDQNVESLKVVLVVVVVAVGMVTRRGGAREWIVVLSRVVT